jgi:hypothetical protein
MDCRRDGSKADFAWIFEYHVQPKQIGIAWVIDSFPTYLSRPRSSNSFLHIPLIYPDLDSFGLVIWHKGSALNLERTGADGKGPKSNRRVTFPGYFP